MVEGFRFTKTFDKVAEHIGYQVTCYVYDKAGHNCTRKRDFSAHGGIERTTLMLKNWCAWCAEFTTADDHKGFGNIMPAAGEDLESKVIRVPQPSKRDLQGSKRPRA